MIVGQRRLGAVVDLLEITLIVVAVWVIVLTLVLCLLTAAKVADESDQRDSRAYPPEGSGEVQD